MKQGTTTTFNFHFNIDLNQVDSIDFFFHCDRDNKQKREPLLTKSYPIDGYEQDGVIYMPLKQEETVVLPNKFYIEPQINFIDKSSTKAHTKAYNMEPTIYTHYLDENQSSGEEENIDIEFEVDESIVIKGYDYDESYHKPRINDNELIGNKTSEELGLQDKLIAGVNITIAADGKTISAANGGKFIIVEELPEQDIDLTAIYLLPREDEEESNIYDEYIYIDSIDEWEKIGSTEVNLDNYYTKDETDELLDDKQDTMSATGHVSINNDVITTEANKVYQAIMDGEDISYNVSDYPNIQYGDIAISKIDNKTRIWVQSTEPDSSMVYWSEIEYSQQKITQSENTPPTEAYGGYAVGDLWVQKTDGLNPIYKVFVLVDIAQTPPPKALTWLDLTSGNYTGGNGIDITNDEISVDLSDNEYNLRFNNGKLYLELESLGAGVLRSILSNPNLLSNYDALVGSGNFNYTTSRLANNLALSIDSQTYIMTVALKHDNTVLASGTVDLPLETMVVDADYDSQTKEIVLTLQSGSTIRFSVADLVSGLVSTDDLDDILTNYYTKSKTYSKDQINAKMLQKAFCNLSGASYVMYQYESRSVALDVSAYNTLKITGLSTNDEYSYKLDSGTEQTFDETDLPLTIDVSNASSFYAWGGFFGGESLTYDLTNDDFDYATQTDLSSKQDTIDTTHKLSADYIQNGSTNKTVTQQEKTSWNKKCRVFDAVYSNGSLNVKVSSYPNIKENDLIVCNGNNIEAGLDGAYLKKVVAVSIGPDADEIALTDIKETYSIQGTPPATAEWGVDFIYQVGNILLSENGNIYYCASATYNDNTETFTYTWRTYNIADKQDTIDTTHKLSADLVDDTNSNNKFVTSNDITNWNGKADAANIYTKTEINNTVSNINNDINNVNNQASCGISLANDAACAASNAHNAANDAQNSADNAMNAANNAQNTADEKADKTIISTDSSTTMAILTLVDNHEYRYTKNLTNLILTMPSGDFIASVVFSSGSTPTQIVCDSGIKWSGEAVDNNVFTPEADTVYNVVFWYDGININAVERGVV